MNKIYDIENQIIFITAQCNKWIRKITRTHYMRKI